MSPDKKKKGKDKKSIFSILGLRKKKKEKDKKEKDGYDHLTSGSGSSDDDESKRKKSKGGKFPKSISENTKKNTFLENLKKGNNKIEILKYLNMEEGELGSMYKKCVARAKMVFASGREPCVIGEKETGKGFKEGGISIVVSETGGFLCVDFLRTRYDRERENNLTLGDKIHIGVCNKKDEKEIKKVWDLMLPCWLEAGVSSVKIETLHKKEAYEHNKIITIYANTTKKELVENMLQKIDSILTGHVNSHEKIENDKDLAGDLKLGSSGLIGYRSDIATVKQCRDFISGINSWKQEDEIAEIVIKECLEYGNLTIEKVIEEGLRNRTLKKDEWGEMSYRDNLNYLAETHGNTDIYLSMEVIKKVEKSCGKRICTYDPCGRGNSEEFGQLVESSGKRRDMK